MAGWMMDAQYCARFPYVYYDLPIVYNLQITSCFPPVTDSVYPKFDVEENITYSRNMYILFLLATMNNCRYTMLIS